MTIKMTVSLPDHVVHYAERLVQEGRYPSLDRVLAASVEDMMSSRQAVDDPVSAMAEELRRRMELPEEEWIPWDGDAMIERITRRRFDQSGR